MVPFTTPVQCQSPRAHLVYARTKALTSNEGLLQIPKYDYSKWNLWRPISKFQEMTQQNWLSLLYACVDPKELHCAPSDFFLQAGSLQAMSVIFLRLRSC